MTDMADIDRQQFEVVRRGYDIDQVDEFLVRQAEAWRERLHEAQRRITELENDVVDVDHLRSEVDLARKQQEALTLTFQTAAQAQDELLAKAEHSAAELRRTAEQEVTQLRAEAETEARRNLAESKAQAAEMLQSAELKAKKTKQQSQFEADQLLISQEQRLQDRQAQLDTMHSKAKASYEEVEKSLSDKVRDLDSMRVALVAGLEAIAGGGLAALEDVSDQLAAVGIVNDSSAVAELTDSTDNAGAISNGDNAGAISNGDKADSTQAVTPFSNRT